MSQLHTQQPLAQYMPYVQRMCHTYRGHSYIHYRGYMSLPCVSYKTENCLKYLAEGTASDTEYACHIMLWSCWVRTKQVRNKGSFQHLDSQNAFQNPATFTCIQILHASLLLCKINRLVWYQGAHAQQPPSPIVSCYNHSITSQFVRIPATI